MHPLITLYGRIAGALPRSITSSLYATPPLTRAIRAGLNAVVPAELQPVEVLAGPLAGARLPIYPLNEMSFVSGLWEYWLQDALLEHLRPGDQAWDVGAYIGYFTLLMRRICGPHRTLALEPDPENRERLEETLGMNDACDVRVLPEAAGSREGTVGLQPRPGHPAATGTGPGAAVQVPVVTLDALYREYGAPRVVKMDVEGAEADVLRGAGRVLAEARPVWLLELHGPAGREAVGILRGAGYRIRHLNPRESRTHQEHIAAEPLSV